MGIFRVFSAESSLTKTVISFCLAAQAVETPIGYLPRPQDIDTDGLDLPAGTMEKLLSLDKEEWREEQKDQEKFFKTFGERFPDELWKEFEGLKNRIG